MGKPFFEIVKQLSDTESFEDVCHLQVGNTPMPSIKVLEEIVLLARSIFFPGYFGDANVCRENMQDHIQVAVEKLYSLLSSQIKAGLCFSAKDINACQLAKTVSIEKATAFIAQLPEIREKLHTDVIAAYNGDPAAKGFGEVIFCYPGLRAIANYRIAHALLQLEVPIIPRIITEMAHSETGIDIHPGAAIGAHFFIDHGTGVVIGETAIIGNNVKMYQGVTLGAKSFPLDENGNPIKGIQRHPRIEDNVVIYSNSTILGTVTIGNGTIIGANLWVDKDVEPGSRVAKAKK
jgi:serine O-acetyltransferase